MRASTQKKTKAHLQPFGRATLLLSPSYSNSIQNISLHARTCHFPFPSRHILRQSSTTSPLSTPSIRELGMKTIVPGLVEVRTTRGESKIQVQQTATPRKGGRKLISPPKLILGRPGQSFLKRDETFRFFERK